MNNSEENYRFVAHIIIEAMTPLKIGSGRANVLTDAVINRDVNGLPYIPGTSILGILRHHLDKETRRNIMGYQDKDEGQGSRLVVTEAKVVGSDGKPVDGLRNTDELMNDQLLQHLTILPIRQHVRINDKGTAANQGKFDEEVIPKGVRFCFDMELSANELGKEDFQKLLGILSTRTFRIGGGSRKGFGMVRPIAIYAKTLNLSDTNDFETYLNMDNRLDAQWSDKDLIEVPQGKEEDNLIDYELNITPVDFILFSSGLGDEKSDMAVVNEPYVEWIEGKPNWVEAKRTVVVPSTSVKGALAHRTAFYYNLFTDQKNVGESNPAVRTLFGCAGNGKKGAKKRGNVLFADLVEKKSADDRLKVVNHVKIDRLTGGTIEGALFAEEPLYAKGHELKLHLMVVNSEEINKDSNILRAFEEAMKDVCRGTLPLGGGVNRGNGCFKGKIIKNGETIYGEN